MTMDTTLETAPPLCSCEAQQSALGAMAVAGCGRPANGPDGLCAICRAEDHVGQERARAELRKAP